MSDFFRTSTGVILEIDVPADGTLARERHDEQVANGDLTLLDFTPVKVDVPGGGYRWEDPPAKPTRTKAAQAPAED